MDRLAELARFGPAVIGGELWWLNRSCAVWWCWCVGLESTGDFAGS